MRCRPLRGWASSCQLLSGTIHFLPNRLCQIVLPAGVRSVPSRGSSVHRIVSDNGPLLPYALVRNFGSNAAIGREWLTFLALLRGYPEEATTPVHGLCPQAVDCNESAASAGRRLVQVELTELAIPHLRPNVGRFPTSRDEGPAANLVRTSFCFCHLALPDARRARIKLGHSGVSTKVFDRPAQSLVEPDRRLPSQDGRGLGRIDNDSLQLSGAGGGMRGLEIYADEGLEAIV